MTLKIPASMYSKGPKNNPTPGKSWDTSGEHAYGDAKLRMLRQSQGFEPMEGKQEFEGFIDLKGKK